MYINLTPFFQYSYYKPQELTAQLSTTEFIKVLKKSNYKTYSLQLECKNIHMYAWHWNILNIFYICSTATNEHGKLPKNCKIIIINLV